MNKKLIFMVLLIIVWCGVIFVFSAMPSDESNSKSKETINTFVEKTLEITNDSGITDKHPSKQKMKNFIEKLNKPLRKCMHASVYFVLGILIYSCLDILKLKNWKLFVITIISSFLYACTDEIHQIFVNGRTASFKDVLIDTFGAITALIIISIILKIKNRKKIKTI